MVGREVPEAGVDAFNRRDTESMRGLYQSVATITNPDSPDPMSVEEMISGFNTSLSAFPDVWVSLGTVVAEGNNVAFEMTWTGTHEGPLVMPDGSVLPPTHLTVSFSVAVMLETEDNLILRERQYYDNLGILDQLGVV